MAAIFVPVSVIVVGVGAMATRGMPDAAHAALSRYLAYRYISPSPSIRTVSQATRPWLFKPQESSATYGDSVHYHVTHNLRVVATKQVSLSPSPGASPDIYRGNDGLAALPYPPEDIWCVLLEAGDQGPDVVLVALHMSLYSADWIVHEVPPAWSAADRGDLIADMGCAIETGR
jgi:hypothetical protein